MDYIYLRAGRVSLRGWGVKSNFIFLPWGDVGVGGSKQIWTKNTGGQGKFFFFYNLSPDYFFFKCEGKAGRGDNTGKLKKFRQGGHMGVLTNIYLFFLFTGWFKTNLNKKVGGKGKLLFFFCNFCLEYFFIKWEGKAGRGGWSRPIKSFCLGVLCTQVSGVWSRCARGISTLYSCAVI